MSKCATQPSGLLMKAIVFVPLAKVLFETKTATANQNYLLLPILLALIQSFLFFVFQVVLKSGLFDPSMSQIQNHLWKNWLHQPKRRNKSVPDLKKTNERSSAIRKYESIAHSFLFLNFVDAKSDREIILRNN